MPEVCSAANAQTLACSQGNNEGVSQIGLVGLAVMGQVRLDCNLNIGRIFC